MTQTPGDLATLEPLEPLETGAPAGAPGAATSEDAMLQALRSGLPAPAINPYCRDKSFYKFLWAGVIMFLGCMMPFGADLSVAGYQTMSGALYLLIAIGMIWTWWGAIAANRSTGASIKWLMLCVIPLFAILFAMGGFEPQKAYEAAVDARVIEGTFPFSPDWGTMFSDAWTALYLRSAESAVKVGNFWRLFGPGLFFVLLGAVIAELYLFGGIVGGAQQNKQMKRAKQEAAAEKRRARKG